MSNTSTHYLVRFWLQPYFIISYFKLVNCLTCHVFYQVLCFSLQLKTIIMTLILISTTLECGGLDSRWVATRGVDQDRGSRVSQRKKSGWSTREREREGVLDSCRIPICHWGRGIAPHQPPYTTEDKLQNDPSQPPMTRGGRSSQLLIYCSRLSLIKKDL